MKKITGNKTYTFETGIENFMIDVVEHKTGDIQFDVWLYRENIGIKEYIVGYMREYEYDVSDIVYCMEGYLVVPDKQGFSWYEAYDEQYN